MKALLSAIAMGFIVMVIGAPLAAAEDLKAMLVKPANGWLAEWKNPNTGGFGLTEAVFEDRGTKVVARLHIIEEGGWKADVNCERDVAITADTVSFNGCNDRDIVLIRDLSDATHPLKSKNKSILGYDWRLKER